MIFAPAGSRAARRKGVVRQIVLPALAALFLGACASAPGAAPSAAPYAQQEAVDVNNTASFPVVVKYYTPEGGLHTLGTVSANRSQRFVLPHAGIRNVFAETESGTRLDRSPTNNPVRIRHVAATGTP